MIVRRGGSIEDTMRTLFERAFSAKDVAPATISIGFRLVCEITPVAKSTAEPTFFESATQKASDLWDSAISNIKSLWNRVTK